MRRYRVETLQESDWKPGASWRLMIADGRVGNSGEAIEIEPERRLVHTGRNEFNTELRDEGYSRLRRAGGGQRIVAMANVR